MTTALTNARVFDGAEFHTDAAVLVDDGRIQGLVGEHAIPDTAERIDCDGGWLVPGFVDVQVNGGGGALFNAAPTVETLRRMAAAHRRFGTTGMLPTLISTDWPTMVAAADAVAAARAAGVPGVLGIHFEGPYLAVDRRGVHDARYLRAPDPDLLELVTRRALGVVCVTLAPERVPEGTIAELVAAGVRVSLGHTQASYERARAALDEGATGFTHLFNAMSVLTSREPGVVGAALTDRDSFSGIIVDGHHVHAETLKIAIRARGVAGMMLVTDAMSLVGTDLDRLELDGRMIVREGGRLTTADGVLAGSNLDMASAVRNVVDRLGLPLADALRMASGNPLAFLGLDADRGRVAPGHRADLVVLDSALRVRRTFIAGSVEAVIEPAPEAP